MQSILMLLSLQPRQKMQFGSARNGWFGNSRTLEQRVTVLYFFVDAFGFLDPLGFGLTSCLAFLFLSNSERAHA
jgi:hypothetical protein